VSRAIAIVINALFWALLISLPLMALISALSCAGWEPTRKAIVRRQAEARLRGCMSGTLCTQTQACIRESVEFCESQGLEATCGTDAAFVEPMRCQINNQER
jgi:hypothetical protein